MGPTVAAGVLRNKDEFVTTLRTLRRVISAVIAAVGVATAAGAAATPPAPSPAKANTFAVALAAAGPRPAASAAERKAHQRVAARLRAAGLRVGFERFTVPGKGASRDVIAIRDVPARCLVIAMAHADSVPPAPGADDNASGVGRWSRCARPRLAARARLRRLARGDRLRGASLHRAAGPPRRRRARQTPPAHPSPRRRPPRPRPRRGRAWHALRAALAGRKRARQRRDAHPRRGQPRNVNVSWLRDSATGNSDHRELALAGAPAAKLGVPDEPCRHTAATRPTAFSAAPSPACCASCGRCCARSADARASARPAARPARSCSGSC